MDVSSINSDLIRGNVTTIILKALSQEDRYGYDILREIEVKSSGQYQLKQPTLYSCLKRLEKQGLISSYWGDQNDTEGGRRRYYSLTDAGRDYLDKMQSEYEYSRTILDSLLSEEKFDFDEKEAPFDINSLRPYTKRSGDDTQNEKVQQTTIEEKKEINISAPVVEKSNENTNVNTNDIPKSSIFAPLDKGGNSYDEGFRHTTKSVNEIIGQISNIIENKNDKPNENIIDKPLQEDEILKAEEKVETPQNIAPEQNKNSTNEQTSIDSILIKKEVVDDEPILSDEEMAEKRQNAKKALGIGQYQETKIDIDKYELPEKKIEIVEKKPEISEEDKIISQKANLIKDELYKNRIENAEKIDKSFEEKEKERQASHELLFGNNQQTKLADENKNEPKGLEEPLSIFDKYSKKNEVTHEKELKKVELTPSPVAPASSFSFRQDKESVVNYRDAFSPLRQNENTLSQDDEKKDEFVQKPASNIDLKTKLFSQGYKLRTYSRENTEDYYSLNYIKKNKINRDCYLIVYALICLEVLIGYGIFKDRFSSISYASICIATLLIPAIPFVLWTINPEKRTRADFNFRTSILNRFMLYLNLLVLVFLIGFFGVGANINDGQTMIGPILIPALLLLNIPLSSVVYLILYKTKKYHIS